MQRHRLATTIAGIAIGIGLAAGIAHAQTTADQSSPPGSSDTATNAQRLAVAPASGHGTHLTRSARKSAHKHEAKAQTAPTSQQTATSASGSAPGAPADAAQNAATPAVAPASWNAAAVPIAAAVATTVADPIPQPNTLVVGGRTVDIAAPDEVNAIDLNADVDASNPPPHQIAAAASGPAQAMFSAKPGNPADRSKGLLSWKDLLSWQDLLSRNDLPPWAAQALATLGGALSAVVVAWFLIGGSPARTYS